MDKKDYVTRTEVDEMLKKFSSSKPATNAGISTSKDFVSVNFLISWIQFTLVKRDIFLGPLIPDLTNNWISRTFEIWNRFFFLVPWQSHLIGIYCLYWNLAFLKDCFVYHADSTPLTKRLEDTFNFWRSPLFDVIIKMYQI